MACAGFKFAEKASDDAPQTRANISAPLTTNEIRTITIDPISARDFDDPISAQVLGADEVRVWVHFADVSAFVNEGGALDLEARSRATSVYVPDTVEPMLPAALSNEACSLVPGAERLAVTVELDLSTLPDDGPTGGFFYDGEPEPW